MVLSYDELNSYIKLGKLIIKGMTKDSIRENGIDMSISNEVGFHDKNISNKFLDISDADSIRKDYIVKTMEGKIILPPGEHVLLRTVETIKMPNNLVGLINLRSTFSRAGIIISPTVIDVGFEGTLTFGAVNLGIRPLYINPNTRFIHVVFDEVGKVSKRQYSGYYQNQKYVTLPQKVKGKSNKEGVI